MSEGGRRRTIAGYVVLLTLAGAVIAAALSIGWKRTAPLSIAGAYTNSGDGCLGPSFSIEQSGKFVTIVRPEDAPGPSGSLSLDGSNLTGRIRCADGIATQQLSLIASGSVRLDARGAVVSAPTLDGDGVAATFAALPDEQKAAPQEREAEKLLGRLMLAIAVVMLAARFTGSLVARFGQPRVMGEVLAGILLGPTLLGAIDHGSIQHLFFPPDVVPLLRAGADIGLVFYMFLVGLELDPELLRGRVEQAAFISHASIAVPMALGMAAAVPLFGLLAPQPHFTPFALFIGVAMSITAFPVLARILVERRMLQNPVGAMTLGAAAVDDVTAWALLALATGVAKAAGSGGGHATRDVAIVIGLAVVYSLVMALGVRRLLSRVSTAFDEAGHVPAGWIAAIFIGVLLAAFTTTWIGIAGIFGAFTMGLVMPRRADLTHDVRRRLEEFVSVVLLPLFFVTTGLKTQLGLLNRPVLWVVVIAVVALAIVCKWTGAMGAARFVGIERREAAAIGALMNTRGLTELIVLNLGLGLHVISPALFSILVIMALVTTFMTGPILRLIDRDGTLSVPASAEVEAAAVAAPAPDQGRPERSILIAPLDEKHAETLITIGAAIASAEPPRELIVVRPVEPSRSPGTYETERRRLAAADEQAHRLRDDLVRRGLWARAAAFTSPDIGSDLIKLSSEHDVDIALLDGRRPLLRGGPPRGAVGAVLERAACDVAVLVGGGADAGAEPKGAVAVAFGGAEHDWAALELGAWIATGWGRGLLLLGAERIEGRDDDRDASKLLASASLLVQRMTGVEVEPRLMPPGREGVLGAASGSGILLLGLSENWRTEGIGDVRATIARSSPVPILFVRRGTRRSALAPPADVTRFAWSRTRGIATP